MGDGVELFVESFLLGLLLLEPVGVLFNVGAAELNFWRSTVEFDLSTCDLVVVSNLTAMLVVSKVVDMFLSTTGVGGEDIMEMM